MTKKHRRRSRKHRHRSRKGTHGLFGLNSLRAGAELKGLASSVVPPLVAGVLTAGTALGIRAYVDPAPNTAQGTVYKFAPLIGTGVGLIGSAALYFMGGVNAAVSSAVSSVLHGALLLTNEAILKKKTGALATLFLPSQPVSQPVSQPAAGPTSGWSAIVPEYAQPLSGYESLGDGEGMEGLDGIVFEQVNGLNAMGEDVNLAGRINASAYGTAPFGDN